VLSSFGLNALSLSLSLKIRYDNRKSDERPKPRMYYLGYENDSLIFFLETDVCVCLSSFRTIRPQKLSHAHTSRARYYHISLKEFKNTIIEEKELYYHE
jgi:hypothetical protein